MDKRKIIRSATVPMSLESFLDGTIRPLMERYELVLVSSPDPELEALHRAHGVRVIGVPMERHISPVRDAVALLRLVRVLRRERPYMVHSMTPKAGLLCMMAAWLARVPRRVHTFTGLVWPTAVGMKRRVLMLTDWLTCACATHIIPEGEGVMHDLQRHITKKPMRVLGYGNVKGVDMAYWDAAKVQGDAAVLRRRLAGDEDVFVFLFVGRLVGDKGLNELVEAFERLQVQPGYEKARLVLVGRAEEELDPLKPATWERIHQLPSIVEAGPAYGRGLLAWYAASDCFVLPSYREGFPNTVLEAGAMGLPSIVTDINGSREIVEDGKNGMVIPSKDAGALYLAMKRMMEDSQLRKSMAENARPMIGSRFEQGFVRQCLLDFYEEIL